MEQIGKLLHRKFIKRIAADSSRIDYPQSRPCWTRLAGLLAAGDESVGDSENFKYTVLPQCKLISCTYSACVLDAILANPAAGLFRLVSPQAHCEINQLSVHRNLAIIYL